jgi:small ligand-binding sensory domain FIST
MRAATGLAQGRRAEPGLAAEAVQAAMDKAGLSIASAVVLYLSSDFAHDPQPAITAAARAANCLQVVGCSAAGVFTEEDWVLDAPAAAALVLGEGIGLNNWHDDDARPDARILTYTAPNALDMHWLTRSGPRYGGVSGDATGQGPFSVWSGGRVQANGRCELELSGVHVRLGVSQGIRPISKPMAIRRVSGHDIVQVDDRTALASLAQELPLAVRAPERIPTHLLMAGILYGQADQALEEGRFTLLPVVAVDGESKSVTVAGELSEGQELFWAMRQPHAAEEDMKATIRRLSDDTLPPPGFALMFPCLGRGPYFYGGQDRDIQALARQFPDMPFIGFYGNGEIAHLDHANRLLQYSVVLALAYDVEA